MQKAPALLVTLALCWCAIATLLSDGERAGAQTPSRGSASRSTQSPRRGFTPSRSPSTSKRPTPGRTYDKSPPRERTFRKSTPDPEKTADQKKGATSPPAARATRSFGQKLVTFIKTNSLWILVILGVALAALLTWFLLGPQRKSTAQPFLEALESELLDEEGSKKYSSTKISAADVNRRLGGSVRETRIETDREYALVVDEEDLKMPPLPEEIDEHTGRQYADDKEIREFMEKKDFQQAYAEYSQRLEADAVTEFHGDLERTLGEYFIRKRDLEKAARILEHHVATHAAEDVDPEVYFNLGYIHVLTNTFNKSRRFLRLFVDSKAKSRHIDRAKAILQKLEKM